MAIAQPAFTAVPYAFPRLPNIRCAFTTRQAGNLSLNAFTGEEIEYAATVTARQSLLDSLGVATWSEVKQVHGETFVADAEPTPVAEKPGTEADGMGTMRKNHALFIKVADCQPVILAHPKGAIAAIHVGWRGNRACFVQTAVTQFCSAYGLDPADIHAVRGPSLGHAEFVNFAREWPSDFAPWYDQATQCMDLWSLTRQQLRDAGLAPGNIHGLDLCTLSLHSLFFSHRNGDAGRQAGLVWMVA